MSLSQGRSYLAIPGPSVMPERVLQAMHQPCPNIYEGGLIELTHSLIPDLKHVVGTAGQAAIYIANGHGAWGSGCIERFGTGRYGPGAGNRTVLRRLGRNGRRAWGYGGDT